MRKLFCDCCEGEIDTEHTGDKLSVTAYRDGRPIYLTVDVESRNAPYALCAGCLKILVADSDSIVHVASEG